MGRSRGLSWKRTGGGSLVAALRCFPSTRRLTAECAEVNTGRGWESSDAMLDTRHWNLLLCHRWVGPSGVVVLRLSLEVDSLRRTLSVVEEGVES